MKKILNSGSDRGRVIFLAALVLALVIGVSQIKNVTTLMSKASAPTVILDEQFTYPTLSIGNWFLNNASHVSIVPEAGSTGNAVAINNPGTNVYIYHFFPNLTARVAVMIKDDISKLTDSSDDSYVFASLNIPGGGVSIGIRPKTSTTNYTICPSPNVSGCMDTKVPRSTGWHQFKIFVTPKGVYGKIDSTSLSYLNWDVGQINSAVNSTGTFFTRMNLGVAGSRPSDNWYFSNVYINSFPAPEGSDPQGDFSKKMLNVYLSDYGTVNPMEVIAGINSRPSYSGCNQAACFEDRLHDYMALGYLALAEGTDYRLSGNIASGDKAISIITAMLNNYTVQPWGGTQSSARVDSLLTQTAWLVWDRMPRSTSSNLETFLAAQANYYSASFRGYNDSNGSTTNHADFNTSGEENAWPGTFLNLASIVYNHRPESANWLNWSRVYLFHVFTLGETYGGITTQTLWKSPDDYLFSNHDFKPHPGYMMGSVGEMVFSDKLRRKYKLPSYPEFSHNISMVWKRNTDQIAYSVGTHKYVDFVGMEFVPSALTYKYPNQKSAIPSGGMANITLYRILKELYPDLNGVGPSGDLSEQAFEYLYYVKDSYLGQPVQSGLTISKDEVSTTRPKMDAFLINGIYLDNYALNLFYYNLNIPLP